MRSGAGVAELRNALDPVAFTRSVGVEPDDWQKELLRSPSDRILLNCSRQSGKSTMAAILGLHQALYHEGSLVLLLAPALRQASELFAKLMEVYSTLGEPLKKYGERRLSLELSNGSRVVALPGSEKTIRGFSGVSLIVVDEAARVPDELVVAVRPMLAVSSGKLMMLSTPFGRRGVFYGEWKGGRDWLRFEVPASMCPRISPEFLEDELRALVSFHYEQEYNCRFMDTPDQFFSTELIEAMVNHDIEPLRF